MSVISEMAVNVIAKTSQLASGLSTARSMFGGMERSLSSMLPSLSGVNALLGGLSVGAVTAGIVSIADGLEAVAQTSERLGVATEEFFSLRMGAANANIEVETFDKAMTKLYKSLGDASRGSSAASKGFEQLGIDVGSFTRLNAATQLSVIAERMQQLPDATQRTSAAMTLFGKAGADMQKMLGGGAEGIREVMRAADEMGLNTFTKDRLDKVTAFNDAMDRLRGLITVQAQSIVIDISPAAEELVTALADVMPYVAEVVRWTAGGISGALGNPDTNNKNPTYNRAVEMFGAQTSDQRTWSSWATQNVWAGATNAAKAAVFGLGGGVAGLASKDNRDRATDTMTTVLREILIESRKANQDNFLIGN